jgi:hypothetical protein
MADQSNAGVSRGDLLNTYIDTVQARMDQETFVVFLKAVLELLPFARSRGTLGLAALETSTEQLSDAVLAEVLQALGIITSGRMDHVLVDLGNGITALVTPELAAGPDALERLRQRTLATSEELHERDRILEGIARASDPAQAEGP